MADWSTVLCYTHQWPPIPKSDSTTLDVMHTTCPPLKLGATAVSPIAITIQLNLIDNLIARHSALNAFFCDVADLTIFVEFIKICMEERLYPHYMHYQNYCMKNKLIERHTPAIQLNIVAVERAEITLARHVQRSIFGKIYTKLSLDAEKYVKAVSQIKNNQLKC